MIFLWYSSFVHECLLYTFWFFAAPLGTWEGHPYSSFLVFRSTSLSCLNPTLAVLHYLRISGLWQPLGIPAQFFHWILLDFFNGLFTGNLNINRALMLILLAAWIGPSLLFIEWAFLWNFGLQQTLTNCADPSTRLQSPTKKVVSCKVLQFIHTMKIKKMLGHKTLWCTYTATSLGEKDELRQEFRLRSQFAWTEFA